MPEKLLLIDGNSIINRAFYGMSGGNMTAPDNTPTGAVYAFLNIYFKFAQEFSPDKVCVCFDLKGPTFRHDMFDDYKATRKPMPEDLAVQIPILKDVLDAMGITRAEMEGFEADDLIGSISDHASSKEILTYILSGDKDDLQLVGDNTILVMPVSRSGDTATEIYDRQAVIEKYSIPPEHFVDLKALMGDPSDNIPGVKGIGIKGATELISKYHTLEKVYDSLDEIKMSVAVKLKEQKEMAFLSRKLSAIKRDISVENIFSSMEKVKKDSEAMYEIFRRLGFRSVISRLGLEPGQDVKDVMNDDPFSREIEIVQVSSEEIISEIKQENLFSFTDIHANARDLNGYGIAEKYLTDETVKLADTKFLNYICCLVSGCSVLMDIGNTEKLYSVDSKDIEKLLDHLRKSNIALAGFGIKDMLRQTSGNIYDLRVFDFMVAGYILCTAEGDFDYDVLAQRTLGTDKYFPPEAESEASGTQKTLFDPEECGQTNTFTEKDIYRITSMHALMDKQIGMLKKQKSLFLALFVEMPLTGVLAKMEITGFKVDVDILNKLSRDFTVRIETAQAEIYSQAGHEFNINSPKQLGEVLFEELGLPAGRKGKSGYSTKAEILLSLKDKHPIIEQILDYRELTKLKSTFLEGLSRSIDPSDGRVHSTFHQVLTSTGRLSSSDPNMQNIPIKKESGRDIRKAFTAEKGYVLIDADYSQIELRLLADFSGDEQMISAFKEKEDIHTATARELFDLPDDMITSSMRSIAKTINFSIVYGIGDYSLSQDLGISVAQAHEYIEEYHKKYPAVRPYLKSVLKKAKDDGYVQTMFNRRRYIQELKSSNRNIRSFGERAAMNAPIQGSAADIIKIAMVVLDKRIREEKKDYKLVSQVHDELILEVPEKEKDEAARILKECMECAVSLSVPLIADVEIKSNWHGGM